MLRPRLLVLTAVAVVAAMSPAAAAEPVEGLVPLVPPVDGPVTRAFEAPLHEYGPGHRGIDYAVERGTAVRAAGDGTITFAGSIGDAGFVTIDHGGGLETTYSLLVEIAVAPGERVDTGRWIGHSDVAHPGGNSALHFGVKLHGDYLDPERVLTSLELGDAIHLAPIKGSPLEALDAKASCRARPDLPDDPEAPNGNIAVAIAGISSQTQGTVAADMYEHGPELLGYAEDRIYRFSYRGIDGPDLHEPYARADTFGDLRAAAQRLGDLLQEIGRRHPGSGVDLIAHSQGGVVARIYLESTADDRALRQPSIEHLVTFAAPHAGAPLAALPDDIDRGLSGLALDGLSLWARAGGPIPDPHSSAVGQMSPGSPLMDELAREDIAFGTRALSLAMPHDAIVPADRARLPGETNRVVAPEGVSGHSAIVRSEMARALAHAFLRDSAPSCESGWDTWGPPLGALIGGTERVAGWAAGFSSGGVSRLIRSSLPGKW